MKTKFNWISVGLRPVFAPLVVGIVAAVSLAFLAVGFRHDSWARRRKAGPIRIRQGMLKRLMGSPEHFALVGEF